MKKIFLVIAFLTVFNKVAKNPLLEEIFIKKLGKYILPDFHITHFYILILLKSIFKPIPRTSLI